MGIELVGELPSGPSGVTPYRSVSSAGNSDNAGSVVRDSVFSDSYARAFMIKTRDAVYEGNTFARAGGIHIGVEPGWLEGDPNMGNTTVTDNIFCRLGDQAVSVADNLAGVGIDVADNVDNCRFYTLWGPRLGHCAAHTHPL